MAGQTRARVKTRRVVRTTGRRVLGAAFLAMLVLFGWLTYATFNKTFTRSVDVTLRTSHAGLQLSKQADVKLRGLIVGEVREVDIDGEGARLDLALKPETIDAVPANVTARILPKTLFGEKYVELVVPDQPAEERLAAGDVITRDRTSVGIELETVLDDTLPLLRTIEPAKLNATLNAMATALEGRGDRLGGNLVRLNDYLTELNPHVPTLNEDIEALADVADTYDQATPDLMRLLENATKTGDTVVLKERALHDLLTDLATTSAVTRETLAENEAALIQVGEVSRPTLELLETYSPEYSCLLEGMARWVPRFEDAFGGGEHYDGSAPALHITLELVPQQRGYSSDDKPYFGDNRGPSCRELPNPPDSQENPAPSNDINDGVGSRPGPGSRVPDLDGEAAGKPTGEPAGADTLFETTSGYAGTPAEQELVAALVGPTMGRSPNDVPDIATLLFGPMARGAEVSLR